MQVQLYLIKQTKTTKKTVKMASRTLDIEEDGQEEKVIVAAVVYKCILEWLDEAYEKFLAGEE